MRFLLLSHSREATKRPAHFPTTMKSSLHQEACLRHSYNIPRGAQGYLSKELRPTSPAAVNIQYANQGDTASLTLRYCTEVGDGSSVAQHLSNTRAAFQL